MTQRFVYLLTAALLVCGAVVFILSLAATLGLPDYGLMPYVLGSLAAISVLLLAITVLSIMWRSY